MALPITTCLWFDNQAEEVANYYVSIFQPNSKILTTRHYTKAGQENHGGVPGSVMIVEFELRGQRFVALNGGKQPWSFNASISFQIDCDNQAEVDHFWDKLTAGGDESRQQCGWVSDKFGLSWQVVPKVLKEMLGSDDRAASDRVMIEMMKMKKLDVAGLEKAFAG
ncbi:hypothetical protein PT974_12582 [Cladobotryum mycophilum]|uniref:PhnB-like domain-containing protein n=1 Tax=Cladobotryum mycophilum TaxID=491253 RepID=A0ABR0S9B7_9HYPO